MEKDNNFDEFGPAIFPKFSLINKHFPRWSRILNYKKVLKPDGQGKRLWLDETIGFQTLGLYKEIQKICKRHCIEEHTDTVCEIASGFYADYKYKKQQDLSWHKDKTEDIQLVENKLTLLQIAEGVKSPKKLSFDNFYSTDKRFLKKAAKALIELMESHYVPIYIENYKHAKENKRPPSRLYLKMFCEALVNFLDNETHMKKGKAKDCSNKQGYFIGDFLMIFGIMEKVEYFEDLPKDYDIPKTVKKLFR